MLSGKLRDPAPLPARDLITGSSRLPVTSTVHQSDPDSTGTPVGYKQRAARAEKYRQLEWLRESSARIGAQTCMWSLDDGARIGATATGVSHVSGVVRCKSSWACPNCAPVIGERRASEIDQAASAWMAKGGTVWFVTATMSHRHGDELGDLLVTLQSAWSQVWRWKHARPAWYGGQIRAVEVTYGRNNGWHPHVHAAIFVEAGHDAEPMLWALSFYWERAVAIHGGSTDVRTAVSVDPETGVVKVAGWHARQVLDTEGLSEYLAKVEGGWGVGLELARLDLKRGAGARKGVTPFQLLAAAVGGDKRAAWLYRGYELATLGRQRIVATRGLMARCEVEVLTDSDAVEVAPVEPMAAEVLIPPRTWSNLLAAGFAARVLDDVADLATGRSGWPWPPEWVVFAPSIARTRPQRLGSVLDPAEAISVTRAHLRRLVTVAGSSTV